MVTQTFVVSLNMRSSSGGEKLKTVKKFSILIQSEEFGSQIKEVNPPKDETIVVNPASDFIKFRTWICCTTTV